MQTMGEKTHKTKPWIILKKAFLQIIFYKTNLFKFFMKVSLV